jgi:hypothetical protein
VLSGALLIQGGRWLYQERHDTGALALIAAEAKEASRVDEPVLQRAVAARESTLEPDAGVRVPPAVPASSPVPAAPPPLVMLEPDPPAAIKTDQPASAVASRVERRMAPARKHAAQQEPASPLPKRSSRVARKPSDAAVEPAKERGKRTPVRQLARASAVGTERPSERDTSMAATLRACREHGYHATQCIKRGCSVTAYGFACRGR